MMPPKLSNERSQLQDNLKKMKEKNEIFRWFYVMSQAGAELAAMAFKQGDLRPIVIKNKKEEAFRVVLNSSRQRGNKSSYRFARRLTWQWKFKSSGDDLCHAPSVP